MTPYFFYSDFSVQNLSHSTQQISYWAKIYNKRQEVEKLREIESQIEDGTKVKRPSNIMSLLITTAQKWFDHDLSKVLKCYP